MRKLIISLAIVICLVVVGAVLWLNANASSLVAAHRGDIEKALSDTLKTKVSFGKIGVSIFPSTHLDIADVQIAGGLSLGKMTLKISPIALLTGTLRINELSLVAPRITLAQVAQSWTVKGLPPPAAAAAVNPDAQPSGEPSSTSAASSQSPSSPIALALDRFTLSDGLVRVEPSDGKPLELSAINVGTGVSFSGADLAVNNLSASLRALGSTIGARAGKLTASAESGAVTSEGLTLITPAGEIEIGVKLEAKDRGTFKVATDNPLKLQQLSELTAQAAPQIAGLGGQIGINLDGGLAPGQPLAISHKGLVSLKDVTATVGQFDLTKLSGGLGLRGEGARHSLASDDISFALNDAPLALKVTAAFDTSRNVAVLDKLALTAFGGAINASGQAGLANGAPVAVQFDLSGIELNQALSVLRNPALAAVSGRIVAVKGDLKTANGPHLKEQLGGTLRFDVQDGSVPGVNVVGPVLKALATIPLLTGSSKAPPPALATAADSPNTAFKSIVGSFQIRDGVAETNDFALTSPLFDLSARGTVSTTAQVNLRASLLFEPIVSAALAGGEAKRILNAQGRLEVPVAIVGAPGSIMVTPDIERLMQTAAGAAVRDAASKFLDKALGGGKDKKKGLFGF